MLRRDGRRGAARAAAAAGLGLVLAAATAARAASPGELLTRGEDLMRAGRHAEAVESLAEALAADPESARIREALGEAWFAAGAAQLGAGHLRDARESLEKAVEAAPDTPGYRVLLGRVLLGLSEFRGARREADLALELAPEGAAARELSGDIHEREGRLNLAAGDWEAALRAGGDAHGGLAAKLGRARREMEAEEGMERESSRYFTVHYDRDVPRPVVAGLFAILDEAFNLLHDRLGEYPRDEIPVFLYSKVAFQDVTRAPDWMGGLFDGKIRIPVGGLSSVSAAHGLLRLLVHEMTHAFLFRMAPTGLPRWFNEGVASSVEGLEPEAARAWLAKNPAEGVATLADLERALLGQRGNVVSAYAAARLALHELEEARGAAAVRRIVSGVGEGRPFAEVFEDEARMSLGEFEGRWRRALP